MTAVMTSATHHAIHHAQLIAASQTCVQQTQIASHQTHAVHLHAKTAAMVATSPTYLNGVFGLKAVSPLTKV